MDSIINEEKGEVSRAINQYDMEGGSKQAIKDELIQTAAMCIRMLKMLEK
jgi:NTP pyrophosphatase (non-canonical NTP hydrolase)